MKKFVLILVMTLLFCSISTAAQEAENAFVVDEVEIVQDETASADFYDINSLEDPEEITSDVIHNTADVEVDDQIIEIEEIDESEILDDFIEEDQDFSDDAETVIAEPLYLPEETAEEELQASDEEEIVLFAKPPLIEGFNFVDGQWGWYEEQTLQKTTGIARGTIDGVVGWYFIRDGIYTKAEGITKKIETSSDSKWYYVKDGKFNKATTFAKKANGANPGTFYYVKNGTFKSATGMVKGSINGAPGWYYVRKGVYTKATGMTKKADTSTDKKWYYVSNGSFKKTTCVAYKTDGTDTNRYYIKNGVFNSYTGNVTINGERFRLNKGVVSVGTMYILNVRSHIFHYPECGSVSRMSAKNKKEFYGSRAEAIAQGYKPCSNCRP